MLFIFFACWIHHVVVVVVVVVVAVAVVVFWDLCISSLKKVQVGPYIAIYIYI